MNNMENSGSNSIRVLLLGGGDIGLAARVISEMREKHGPDVLFYTPEEAKEQGLTMDDFTSFPTFEITPLPKLDDITLPDNVENKRRKTKGNRWHKWNR